MSWLVRFYFIWMSIQEFEGGRPFFLNNTGTRAGGEFLSKLLKALIERTQNPSILRKEITLHCLRHSIATHLLDHGAAMEFVQEFLGHTTMDTSMLYSKRRKQRMVIQQQFTQHASTTRRTDL